ncbi:MAG TPA: response regulator transcription factor [Magnetospirillaceae bacterium]|nr:response regulator transcription factor [Magnetospirillaceae bacterium]
MAKASILIVEDEPEIRELIAYNLGRDGYTVIQAATGEEGIKLASKSNPDAIVLDVMLPGMDGLEVLRRLKSDPALRRIPVILGTARGEDTDVVSGLELGADDYVTKPFSPKVLIARIRAALRRTVDLTTHPFGKESAVSLHGIVLDSARHEVTCGGKRVYLSATEFSLLEFFLRNPGWVFSRPQIIDAVKGRDYPVTDRAVDVQILSLRKKLEEYGECVETVRGVGYKMKDGGA